MYIIESLCCAAEINTTLQINYNFFFLICSFSILVSISAYVPISISAISTSLSVPIATFISAYCVPLSQLGT